MADDLERRAIIAAHNAQCACVSKDQHDDYGEYRGLTVAERAIVELWRDDVEQLRSHDTADTIRALTARVNKAEAEVERLSTATGMADELGAQVTDERNEAQAAIERVRAVLDRSDNRNGSARPRQDRIPAVDIINALDGSEAP